MSEGLTRLRSNASVELWPGVGRAVVMVLWRMVSRSGRRYHSLTPTLRLFLYLYSVKGLGYTNISAQLFSVPPYAVAAFLTVLAAISSDRFRIRGPIMLAFLPISIIGYAIIRTTTNTSIKYGALFLMAGGLYPSGECDEIDSTVRYQYLN